MFSIPLGCEEGLGQCFQTPPFPHRACSHLQLRPALLPSTPARDSNSCPSCIITVFFRMPSTSSMEAKRYPGALHRDSTRIPQVESQETWPVRLTQFGICLWLAVPLPALHQQVAWYTEIPYQLPGPEQPQCDFSLHRLLKQTL